MEKTKLGRTELLVGRTGFGCLPIQRVSMEESKKILRKAFDGGIDFYDTAIRYTDSEEKIRNALQDVRANIVLATKGMANTREGIFKELTTSLKNLGTDYVDLYQLHNPSNWPDPEDPNGIYQALLEAKRRGMIRHIGITCHRLDMALRAAKSGLYETIQYPLSALSSEKDLDLIRVCQENDVGLIAMKALCGGILTNARTAFAFLRQYQNVVPIWGIQKESELDEFLALEKNPPELDDKIKMEIKKDQAELAEDFCRACGYCLPCPADIPIPTAARMTYMLKRGPHWLFTTKEWQAKMAKISDCIDCGHCRENCPYELDTPNILRKMLVEYEAFIESKDRTET